MLITLFDVDYVYVCNMYLVEYYEQLKYIYNNCPD